MDPAILGSFFGGFFSNSLADSRPNTMNARSTELLSVENEPQLKEGSTVFLRQIGNPAPYITKPHDSLSKSRLPLADHQIIRKLTGKHSETPCQADTVAPKSETRMPHPSVEKWQKMTFCQDSLLAT